MERGGTPIVPRRELPSVHAEHELALGTCRYRDSVTAEYIGARPAEHRSVISYRRMTVDQGRTLTETESEKWGILST